MNKLFGPLDASYCTYFYFISIFAFFSFVGCVLSCLYSLVNKKKTDYNDYKISPKRRQTLQHWGYFLTKKDCK